MPWQGRVLPTLMKWNKPRASRPLNSTGEPTRGSGDVRLRILVTIGASFLIAFKERSTIVLGVGLILYSLLTDYERGIPGLKFIPMPVHLILDFVAAAFLVAAPFLFGFANQGLNVWLPFVIAGVGVIILVLVSQTHAYMKAKAKAVA